jgi:dTDP-4-amino-4,6-dideoxygalactose transaminase
MEILAIEGGSPIRSKNPIVETDLIEEAEINALLDVARQKKLRRAGVTEEYEKALAEWYGVKHAIAVANGTVSLHAALAALEIGPGDEVIVTPYTFIASDASVFEQNAIPIFADINPVTLTIDPNDIERKISDRTKAIIPVSIFGVPMDIGAIMDIANKHDLKVIEDNAQAPGATYKGRKLGTFGHISSYSTISGKIMSTGEGGYLLTDDDDLYEKMWGYVDFSRRKRLGMASKFHFGIPCTNYRITNMQAAIGLQQLKKLDMMNARRMENAQYLDENLKDIPGIQLIPDPEWGKRVYYYYCIRIQPEILGANIIDFAKALAAEGIYDYKYITTTRMMIAQHLQPLFLNQNGYGKTQCPFNCPLYGKEVEYKKGQHPVAEKAAEEIFWLSSVHPALTQADLADTVLAVRKVANGFVERNLRGLSNHYATEEELSRAWDPNFG